MQVDREPRAPRPRRAQRISGLLDKARRVGDPPADVLVARLSRGARLEEVDRLLATVHTTRDPLPLALPASVRRFLATEGLPAWADPPRLARAQRFAAERSAGIACALFCASLPMAFTGAKGVAILRATGRLEGDLDRRVNETGRFVFDVLMPGGFEDGPAVRSTQKVRLMHAVVRHRVLSARRAAGAPAGEIPIHQEDLLGTLVCFSVVVLDTLAKLGAPATPGEADDFLHLWRVVGAMLGIQPEWMPTSVDEARRLGEIIRARRGAKSEDGRALSRVLVDGVERHLPARGLGVVAPGLMRWLLGEPTAAALALPEGVRAADLDRLVPHVADLLRRARRSALGAWLPGVGRAVLERVMDHKLGGARPSFHTPLQSPACPHARPSAARGRS